ncbi:uncharacterized protein [Narcine bancroftii]|uniref:uncharacterized protein n=1 Tax=Narcine bancroftii TaxID=1343680 RepID=UPI003831AC88
MPRLSRPFVLTPPAQSSRRWPRSARPETSSSESWTSSRPSSGHRSLLPHRATGCSTTSPPRVQRFMPRHTGSRLTSSKWRRKSFHICWSWGSFGAPTAHGARCSTWSRKPPATGAPAETINSSTRRQFQTVTPIPHIQDFTANVHGVRVFSKVDLVRRYHQIPVHPEDIGGHHHLLWLVQIPSHAVWAKERRSDFPAPHGLSGKEPGFHLHLLGQQTCFQQGSDATQGPAVRPLLPAGQLQPHHQPSQVPVRERIHAVPGPRPLRKSPLSRSSHARTTSMGCRSSRIWLTSITDSSQEPHASCSRYSPSSQPNTKRSPGPQRPAVHLRPPRTPLRRLPCEATMLAHPHTDLHMVLSVDASATANGTVLEQQVNGQWKPLAFFSRLLHPPEHKYSSFNRELLGMYLAIRHFHYFLEGRTFTIFIDHKPLTGARDGKGSLVGPPAASPLLRVGDYHRHLA